MLNYKTLGRIILALAVCPLSLFVIWHRKFWKFFWFLLLSQFLLFLLLIFYNCIFYEGMKLFYTYDVDEIRVVEDSSFLFDEMGYSASYKLNSKYYLSHRILLIPEPSTIPVEYEYNGQMLIEIFDKNKQLLHSFKADKPGSLLRLTENDYIDNYMAYAGSNYSHSTSVFAFELGEIPFNLIRLKRSRLKNMVIKVTVLKPEKGLQEFCEKATLVIVPDLRH
jgi:energy-coupling factor transporter transmembrane protein EcfT